MATPEIVIQGLPELSWRYKRAPCEIAPIDFSHGQAERRYPYVDAAGHDWTGRDPSKFNVRLFFLNTVQPKSFPELWEDWRTALEDGSSGDLNHPILGIVRARVLSWHVDLKAQATAGIVVDVVFTETRDDLDTDLKYTPADVVLDAAVDAATTAASSFGINYPDGKNKLSLLQAFGAIKGSIFSAALTVNGAINSVMGNVATMIDAVDALDDPMAWPAYDLLTQVYSGLSDLKAAADAVAARSVAIEVCASDTTLDGFATAKGNTTAEIMSLNLSALNSPIVPRGTALRYYSGK